MSRAISHIDTFQGLILALQNFWAEQGCVVLQPYDLEMGAGTFHTATFLRALGPETWNAAYVQPSRRPKDGRYGENPNRLQHYYQFQVVLKPNPSNIQQLYLDSLKAIGIDTLTHDVRFVEDNWESPTLGAWGLGWEVWLDGMEVTQFTYFQQVGGIVCDPVAVEITYGTERLAMYLQGVESVFDIIWNKNGEKVTTYAEVHKESEYEFSKYHFEVASVEKLLAHFEDASAECRLCLEKGLPLAAYDQCMMASHAFNILDARKAISQAQRQNYILKVRELAIGCAQLYKDQELDRARRLNDKTHIEKLKRIRPELFI